MVIFNHCFGKEVCQLIFEMKNVDCGRCRSFDTTCSWRKWESTLLCLVRSWQIGLLAILIVIVLSAKSGVDPRIRTPNPINFYWYCWNIKGIQQSFKIQYIPWSLTSSQSFDQMMGPTVDTAHRQWSRCSSGVEKCCSDQLYTDDVTWPLFHGDEVTDRQRHKATFPQVPTCCEMKPF